MAKRQATIDKINNVLYLQSIGKTRKEIEKELNIKNLTVFMNQQGYMLSDNGYTPKENITEESEQTTIVELLPSNVECNVPSNTHETDITPNITTVLQQQDSQSKLIELINNADELLNLLKQKDTLTTQAIELTFNIKSNYKNYSLRVAEEVKEQWNSFQQDWSEYRSQELLSQALVEFMENHKKEE